MNPYATHLSMLIACLRRTTGPILELGAGWYSTPIINAFAFDGRLARTIESDANWFGKVSAVALNGPMSPKSHQMIFVPDYANAPIDDQHWAVALIDNEPPGRRGSDLARLKGKCELIIAHDTEHGAYNYDPVIPSFKYQFTQRTCLPWTTVVSDTMQLDWLSEFAD